MRSRNTLHNMRIPIHKYVQINVYTYIFMNMYSSVYRYGIHIIIGSIQPPVPSSPHKTTNPPLIENSNLTFATKIHADSSFFKLHWCFVGSDDDHVCCACGEQCSEQDWVLKESKDVCSCKYSCSLTVNSVSMRYNNGSFYSEICYGRNATLDIIHVTVISKDDSHDHKPQSLYYIIGSGAAVIIIIFLAIGVICNIRERHCCSSKITYNIHHPVDQPSSRKQAILCIL